jgi:hypothetical protein
VVYIELDITSEVGQEGRKDLEAGSTTRFTVKKAHASSMTIDGLQPIGVLMLIDGLCIGITSISSPEAKGDTATEFYTQC